MQAFLSRQLKMIHTTRYPGAFQRHFRTGLYFSDAATSKGGQATFIEAKLDQDWLSVRLNSVFLRFHYTWLRHHCQCSLCLDPKTKQRTIDVTSLIERQMNPRDVHVNPTALEINWQDGHKTEFCFPWLEENAYDGCLEYNLQSNRYGSVSDEYYMALWNRDVIAANPPKEYLYQDIVDGKESILYDALDSLFRYGFVFVNNTPTDEEATLNIGKKMIGPIRETPEGRVYSIENKALKDSDLSHFSHALEGHTDFSFYSDPPGVQVFHCFHHYGTGGMSLLVDGFKAAKTLYQEDPEAFHVLSTIPLRFVNNYYKLQSQRTIFELDPFTKAVSGVRWNTSRIAPLTKLNLDFEEMGKLYHALWMYRSIVGREENELWFKLTPGKVALVDNRRILHGRSAVQGPRKLIGYYISTDDYIGKWKEGRLKNGA